MSIYSDIKKATQIPHTDEDTSFVLQRKSNIPKKNPKPHKPKRPRNMNLYDIDDNQTDDHEQKSSSFPRELHENEIALSIKQANCGVSYSNESLEKYLQARQIEASLNLSIKDDSKKKCDVPENINDEEYFLKLNKLHRNAAIRGLLKLNKISLHDLHRPDISKDKEHGNDACAQENVSQLSNLTQESYPMKLVPHPEDSEVLVQPLHAYGKLDENKYKNIDFSVARIGKKSTVTPQQFFVSMDESEFDFVKRSVKKN